MSSSVPANETARERAEKTLALNGQCFECREYNNLSAEELAQDVVALLEENERLRKALQRIAENDGRVQRTLFRKTAERPQGGHRDEWVVGPWGQVARDALKWTEGGNGL